MPIHTLQEVSKLLPETQGMIKKASLETNFPTSSREEVLLSALEVEYLTKIAHSPVDIDVLNKVAQAVDLYGMKGEIHSKSDSMIKSASAVNNTKGALLEAENVIDTELLTMSPNLEKIAEASEALVDQYIKDITSDNILMYGGAFDLDKSAAINALEYRRSVTGVDEFHKVAQVIEATDCQKLSIDDNRAIINTIKGIEKSAGYTDTNVYTDMFIKKAAVTVTLYRKSVPVESLISIAPTVSSTLGSDIGNLLKDAANNIDAIQALPQDVLQAIEGLV